MGAGTLAAAISGLATSLGALPFLFVRDLPRRAYDGILGLGAGLMLAAATLGLLGEAVHDLRADDGTLALGRVRPPGRHGAPREIDVDLLLSDAAVIDEPPDLVVPHPRLLRRPFVRIPLAEVAAPGLVHPLTGEPLDRASPAASVRLL